MPNMCHGRVSVTGSAEALREFRDHCFLADGKGRLGPGIDAVISRRGAAAGDIGWDSGRGTQPSASYTEILADDAGRVEFRFAAPWQFPWPVFVELGCLFPDLSFDIVGLDPDTGDGFRGIVAGLETSQEPVDPTEVDNVVRWLFQPQAAAMEPGRGGRPSFYALMATRQFFAVTDLATDTFPAECPGGLAETVRSACDDLNAGKVTAFSSREDVALRYQPGSGDAWAAYRQALRTFAKDRGCLVLVDDLASEDEPCVVATLASRAEDIDEAEITSCFKERILDHLGLEGNEGVGSRTLVLGEPRFFSVFRLPAGDYATRTRAFFEERGERLFRIGTM
jgi:hypothetical protein